MSAKQNKEAKSPEKKVTPKKKKKEYEINVYTAWCKACGICIEFCPTQVLGRNKQMKATPVAPEKCIGCNQCVLRCPDFAIIVEEKKNSDGDEPDNIDPGTTEG